MAGNPARPILNGDTVIADEYAVQLIDRLYPKDNGLELIALAWAVRRTSIEATSENSNPLELLDEQEEVRQKWRTSYARVFGKSQTEAETAWPSCRSSTQQTIEELLRTERYLSPEIISSALFQVAEQRIGKASVEALKPFWREHWPYWLALCWIASDGHFEDIRTRIYELITDGGVDLSAPEPSLRSSIIGDIADHPETALRDIFKYDPPTAPARLMEALVAGKIRALGRQASETGRQVIPADQFALLQLRNGVGEQISFCPINAEDGDPRCWRDVVFEATSMKSAFPTIEADEQGLSEWALTLFPGYYGPPWQQVKQPLAGALWLAAREKNDQAAMATAASSWFSKDAVDDHELWRGLISIAQNNQAKAAAAGHRCSPALLAKALLKIKNDALLDRAAEIVREEARSHWSYGFSLAFLLFRGDLAALQAALKDYLEENNTEATPLNDKAFASVSIAWMIILFDTSAKEIGKIEDMLLERCRSETIEVLGRIGSNQKREAIPSHELAETRYQDGKLVPYRKGQWGSGGMEGRPEWFDIVLSAEGVKKLLEPQKGISTSHEALCPDPKDFAGNAAQWFRNGGKELVVDRMREICPDETCPQIVIAWFAAEIWNDRCPENKRGPGAFKISDQRQNRK